MTRELRGRWKSTRRVGKGSGQQLAATHEGVETLDELRGPLSIPPADAKSSSSTVQTGFEVISCPFRGSITMALRCQPASASREVSQLTIGGRQGGTKTAGTERDERWDWMPFPCTKAWSEHGILHAVPHEPRGMLFGKSVKRL